MVRYEPEVVTALRNLFIEKVHSKGNLLDPTLNPKAVLKIITGSKVDSVRELGKSDDLAAKLRTVANRFYRERKFDEALARYNESICYVEPGSEQLGMGYANRSAVYLEQDEYEFALYNIDLAKKHNYPERLMEKLLAREVNCKQQIAAGKSKGTVPLPRMNINVDTNPRIPYLAKGIKVISDPKFGRGLFAEKDFNPGDIVLDEKIELCGLDYGLIYLTCNQCSAEFCYSLIPCPTCPFFMYCSQECLELNWKLYHRFECGVATKLSIVSCITDMLFSRFFFYGLSQFNDNLQAMMDYCESADSAASNPLDLDFTNLNRLDIFKSYLSTKTRSSIYEGDFSKNTAACFYVAFLKSPMVSSIIRTEKHRTFFFRSLLAFSRLTFALMASVSTTYEHRGSTLILPIGSLCNHSCDPNATIIVDSGCIKMTLLRPIRKGEQISTSYGASWWREGPKELSFECQCIVCDQQRAGGGEWRRLNKRPLPPKALQDMRTLQAIVNGGDSNQATKLNAIQQFVKRYSHLHPQGGSDLGEVLKLYYLSLNNAVRAANLAGTRARLQAALVET